MEYLDVLYDPQFRELDIIEIDSDDEEDDDATTRVPRRYIRDGQNPFELYSNVEFKRRYRFTKDAITNGILPKIEEGFVTVNNRGLPVAPVIQLLVCLRFYATASFRIVSEDFMSLSQPTVSRIVFKVSTLLAMLLHEYIKMPSTTETQVENRRLFNELGNVGNGQGLPGIDGAIDCSHIRLTETNFQKFLEVYRNRRGYFSLNVQAVVGPRMEFLDIVPEWPGSEHDSRIFQNSRIYMRYKERLLTGSLVGDASYPRLPFLLKPLANPVTDAEKTYNLIHGKTRRIIETAFGVWKRRFPCLSKGLATKLICTTTIVVACAVLHNISLVVDDILPEDDEEYEDDAEVAVNPNHRVVRAAAVASSSSA